MGFTPWILCYPISSGHRITGISHPHADFSLVPLKHVAGCGEADTCTGGAVVISWAPIGWDLYSCYWALKSRSVLRKVQQTYCYLFFVVGLSLCEFRKERENPTISTVLKCFQGSHIVLGIYPIQALGMLPIKCHPEALSLGYILTSLLRTLPPGPLFLQSLPPKSSYWTCEKTVWFLLPQH